MLHKFSQIQQRLSYFGNVVAIQSFFQRFQQFVLFDGSQFGPAGNEGCVKQLPATKPFLLTNIQKDIPAISFDFDKMITQIRSGKK